VKEGIRLEAVGKESVEECNRGVGTKAELHGTADKEESEAEEPKGCFLAVVVVVVVVVLTAEGNIDISAVGLLFRVSGVGTGEVPCCCW